MNEDNLFPVKKLQKDGQVSVLKSMTGYGRSSYSNEELDIDIAIKSVNSRFLDVKFYMPKEIQFIENELKNLIKERITRAKVEVKIKYKDVNPPELMLDKPRFSAYYNVYREAAEIIGSKQDIPIDKILSEKDVIKIPEKDLENSDIIRNISNTMVEALNNHTEMSLKEGKSMALYLTKSLSECTSALHDIEELVPAHKDLLFSNLKGNMEELLKDKLSETEMKRVMLEVAVYVDKADITEEIVRLKDHILRLGKFIDVEKHEKGKKINFILQEMHREINTIGSKFCIIDSFDSILKIKEEIEKCREIIQNVE